MAFSVIEGRAGERQRMALRTSEQVAEVQEASRTVMQSAIYANMQGRETQSPKSLHRIC